MAYRKPKLKKPSAGKPSEQLDFHLTLFVDENHSRNVAFTDELVRVGLKVELHHHHFGRGEDDEVWIPEVGRKGWIVITTDDNIRRRAVEKRQVLRAKVRLFVFTNNNLFGKAIGRFAHSGDSRHEKADQYRAATAHGFNHEDGERSAAVAEDRSKVARSKAQVR
jgi:hypothetical protein